MSIKIPGLIDAHVHLRVPGGEHKEDFRTGSAAALAGGFTAMLAMPNTRPPLTDARTWQKTQFQAEKEGLCDINHFAGVEADKLDELPALGRMAHALKLYMDDTYNQPGSGDRNWLRKVAALWTRDKVLAVHAVHAEGESQVWAIEAAADMQRPVHIVHVSRKEEIERIALAKAQGVPITCEVTPHHLFLTQADAQRLGALGDMRPLLAEQRDVDALWAHLDTTIDMIASDHAPHTLAEKSDTANPSPGVPGLESTLPLLLTAIAQGRLTLDRLLALMHTNPRRIYQLPHQPDTWVEIDPDARYTFPDHALFTKCGWSPFSGMPLQGRVLQVVLRGKKVYANGQLL